MHTTEVIDMNDIPTKAVKIKKDSSTVVAFRLLKEGKADGLVSSGSTGAVLTAGVLILGRIKGVSRPALCPLIPNHGGTGTLVCDVGADLECKPINLVHFAMMASAYAEAAYGIKNPKVGLLNNGTEDHKGLPLQQEVNGPQQCLVGAIQLIMGVVRKALIDHAEGAQLVGVDLVGILLQCFATLQRVDGICHVALFNFLL